ncbi:DUF5994 family protein [Streptomyces sp. NPDC052492]|uniref:DUF5994 family protein n=1 Tax=Streptomyces sp. NPDC052492 TaxID=3365691 RepID=UPI0037CCE108
MTVTISRPTTSAGRSAPSLPRPAPAGSAPALLDGAWWPRSRDLRAEPPAVLDPLRGRIIRITVNPDRWPVVPRKVPVAGHVVKADRFRAEQDPHELLFSRTTWVAEPPGRPPATDPARAAWLTAAASDLRRGDSASRLMAAAPSRLRWLAHRAGRSSLCRWVSERRCRGRGRPRPRALGGDSRGGSSSTGSTPGTSTGSIRGTGRAVGPSGRSAAPGLGPGPTCPAVTAAAGFRPPRGVFERILRTRSHVPPNHRTSPAQRAQPLPGDGATRRTFGSTCAPAQASRGP